MERIKQALDKARAEATTQGVFSDSRAVVKRIPSEIVRSDIPRSGITYTDTKVLPLDPQHLERNRVIAGDKDDPRSISFDMLRTRLLHEIAQKGWRTVAVTSPTSGCGKAVVAINLAFSMARHESTTVLLADFDLRRPRVSAYLGIDPEFDLSDYLDGRAELSSVLVNPGKHGLVVLPNKKPFSDASEILSGPQVQALVSGLKNRYESRVVLFNVPSLLRTDDAIAFLPQLDCVLLVVADGQTTKAEIGESLRLLEDKKVVGTVYNKADARYAS